MSANEEMLELLETVAARLGVKVSYEAMQAGSNGGLCRVKGEYRLIVDKKAPVSERVATMAHSLAPLDWAALDLPARVQARLRQVQMRRAS